MATRRKSTRKKSTRRGRKSTGVAAMKKKIGGETFTKKGCSSTKSAAQKMAENHRAKGKRAKARVVKTGKGYCVYTKG